MQDLLLIGIDLGGTNIKAVLTNSCGDILDESSTPTHDIAGKDNSAEWKKSVKQLIDQFKIKNDRVIQAIGISTPGTVNKENTGVLSCGTKMLGIEDFTWEEFLNERVCVLNDAHSALFAESRLGAGKGYKDIVMVTLGTGVGGGILINGELIQGQIGRAGHLGHISVNRDHLMSIVNTPGSLENAIGECTLAQRSYGKFLNSKELVEAYNSGDTFANWVWINSVQSLSRGLISIINVLSPELIILGGGVAKAKEALMKPLQDFLEIYEWRPKGHKTLIKLAKLGNHAGAIGAALFALEKTHKQ